MANLASTLVFAALIARASIASADSPKVEGKKHYDLGKAHYNLKDWSKAIAEFKIAYDLFPDPVNLFNIAQAYRLDNNCAEAVVYYTRYQKEEKNKRLRDSVDEVRKKMEECVAKQPKDPLPVPPAVPPVSPKAGEPAQPLPVPPLAVGAAPLPMTTHDNALRPVETPNLDPNRNRRILGYVLLGTGGVFIVGGLVGSLQLASIEGQLEDCDTSDEGCSDFRIAQLKDKRDRASVSANGAYAIGFSAAIVGGVIYVFSRKPKQDSGRVTVTPMRGGAGLSWRF